MNDQPTQPPTPYREYSGSSETDELTVLLAKILTLVAPTSMTTEQQELWLRAAIDALQGIRAAEVRSIILELQRSATRPNQIVPEISRLVAARRRNTVNSGGLDAINAERVKAGLGAVRWTNGKIEFADPPECSLGKKIK